jgi:hypothetical protein
MSARNETKLTAKQMEAFRLKLPQWVFLRHQDVRASGHPDITSTGLKVTSWIEVKHGAPDFDSTGIQELTMLRLARQGHAWYLIFKEDADGENKCTLIVQPCNLMMLTPDVKLRGFDYAGVALWLEKTHAEVAAHR